jgi:CrcB protein
MLSTLAQVALGGAIGASCRYLAGLATLRLIGPGFPWGTFLVNVIGAFLMGVVVVVLSQKGGTRFAPFLMTGVLGGFTTFSAFSLDAFTLWERGEVIPAALYVGGTVVLTLAGIVAGIHATRWVLA